MVAFEVVLFKRVSRTKVKLAIARVVYVVLRMFLREDRRLISRGGVRYDVDISDGLDLSLYLFGFHQKYVTNLKYLELCEDAVVLDVGANMGATALRYAKRVPRGRVYAFEASVSAFARLERNLLLNPELAERIVPVRSLVSEQATPPSRTTVYASWNLKTAPEEKRHAVHGGVAASVDGNPAVTLDRFCEDHGLERVDLIKIDTDGHEMAVLNGATRVIEAFRPAVLFEVGLYLLEERGVGFGLLFNYFSSRGYEMVNAKNGRQVTRANYEQEIPARATIDILALPTADAVDTPDFTPETHPHPRLGSDRASVIVIGGGIAGLVGSRTLAQHSDADILLLERANVLGGLASSFEIEPGNKVERFYHFICKPDRTYFRLMKELGISDRLRWKTTDMGLYHDGRLFTLGDPVSLARFDPLSWREKYRFAKVSARVKWARSSAWRRFEDMTATEWLIERYGKRSYDLLYEPLMRLKFREHADRVSAAWAWARFYRLSKSRTMTQRERVGYLDGGSQLVIDRLEQDLRRLGVEIRTGTRVDGLDIGGDRCLGVRIGGESVACDFLVSTMPTPYLLPLVDLDGPYWDNLRSLDNIGVVLILLRLRRRFSRYFWMNISDPRVDLAGIIEFTNLNPCPSLGGDSLVYLPQYVDSRHPLFGTDDDELIEQHLEYLKVINPEFDESWVKQQWVHRERFSQPICRVGFTNQVPDMQTPVRNLFITDSHQLHPHDRGISASIDLGNEVASKVLSELQAAHSSRSRLRSAHVST